MIDHLLDLHASSFRTSNKVVSETSIEERAAYVVESSSSDTQKGVMPDAILSKIEEKTTPLENGLSHSAVTVSESIVKPAESNAASEVSKSYVNRSSTSASSFDANVSTRQYFTLYTIMHFLSLGGFLSLWNRRSFHFFIPYFSVSFIASTR